MARTTTRGGNSRKSHNNNPTGRNQYSSDWGVMEIARDRPVAAAAVAAGAAAAGLFLWSKRTQISDQLSSLSDQFSEWREGMGSDANGMYADDTDQTESFMASSPSKRRSGRKTQAEISEEALTLKETGKTNA